jgi:hypothetical protein
MCAVASVGKADLQYSFSYVAETGPLQSFAISFTVPDFVTGGASPSFTPFTLTDGNDSWTMTNDLIESGGTGVGCFLFGSASAQLTTIFGPCSFAVADGAGAFVFATNAGLPSTVGTYASTNFTGIFDTPDGDIEILGPTGDSTNDAGAMSLTILETSPEPSTIVLLALCLLSFLSLCGRKNQKNIS